MFRINIKFALWVLIFLALITSTEAQSQFTLRVGGSNVEFANSLTKTSDGGYAVAGFTESFGGGEWDMYIVKLSSSGMIQWTRTVGGTNREDARSIIQTTDGGYAVAGYTGISYDNTSDMLIVKLNAGGTLQWARTVGGAGGDVAYSIIQTQDGGYVVAGYSNSFGAGSYDMYFVKLDASGTIQWSKTVGGIGSDMAFSIIQTADSGYVVSGYTASFGAGQWDFYIVKLNSNGSLQWSRTVGGPNHDGAASIIQTTDGGYAVAGVTYSFGATNGDMYIVKLDSGATIQWTKTFDAGNDEWANGIIQTADGGYIVAGITEIWAQGDDFACILKLSESGSLQWNKIMGGGAGGAASIVRTNDGGFTVAGFNWSFGIGNDMFVIKFNAGGETCGSYSSPSITSGTGGILGTQTPTIGLPNSLVTTPTLSISTGGMLTPLCLVGIEPVSNEIPESYKLHQNYPNPFNPETTIKYSIPKTSNVVLRIYDVLGNEMVTLVNEKKDPGVYSANFNAASLSSGVYFYKIEAGDFTDVKKMVLIK